MSPSRIGLDEAEALEASDPWARDLRSRFAWPRRADGRPVAYFAGNSLGLMPLAARAAVERVLDTWADHAVGGHFAEPGSWYRYDEPIAARCAPLVGARPHEVGVMGSLTEDLHLLLASFHRPAGDRKRILVEPHAFPSDRYAVSSRVRMSGGDPDGDVIVVPTAHPDRMSLDDLAAVLESHGDTIATALIGGVNYYTGQVHDMASYTRLLHDHGVTVGLDLAHAVGNIELALHDWDVDFAAWCTYKYLNSGPGATAGFFVHERHGLDPDTPRLAGWWGNDPDVRFDMHGQDRFVPRPGADGWKVSNPSILALAPLGASLELFAEIGMEALVDRSRRLTAFLQRGLDAVAAGEVITPEAPWRGCQLSLRVSASAGALERDLARDGIIVDARDPDVIRVAPTPMTTSFADVVELVDALASRS